MAENESSNGHASPRKGKLKILLLWLILIVMVGGAGATFWLYKDGKLPLPGISEKKVKYKSVEVGDITVSLGGNGGTHYLRITPVLECPDKKPLLAEIAERKHEIKDAMITVLRAKDIQEVRSVEQVELLKKELLDAINKRLDSGAVDRLYFIEYMVQ